MKLRRLEKRICKLVYEGLEEVVKNDCGKRVVLKMRFWRAKIWLSSQTSKQCYVVIEKVKEDGSIKTYPNVNAFIKKIVKNEWENSHEKIMENSKKAIKELQELKKLQFQYCFRLMCNRDYDLFEQKQIS